MLEIRQGEQKPVQDDRREAVVMLLARVHFLPDEDRLDQFPAGGRPLANDLDSARPVDLEGFLGENESEAPQALAHESEPVQESFTAPSGRLECVVDDERDEFSR